MKDAIDNIYKEKREFIVLGLTGLTGSGCSFTANLLNTPLDEWNFSFSEYECSETDRRKFEIIKAYALANKEYFKFEIIEVKNAITSFILDKDYNSFLSYVRTFSTLDKFNFSNEFKSYYETMHIKRMSFKKNVEDSQKIFDDNVFLSDEIYEFYFKEIGILTNQLKEELEKIQTKLYTKLFQEIGKNIRLSGQIDSNELNSDSFYLLSRRINMLIKILRKRNLVRKEGVRVVIDALRNPLEISFFKDRYSSFYVFSINSFNKERHERLKSAGLSEESIFDIEKTENKEKLEGNEQFSTQNIPRCLQVADVHLANHNDGPHNINNTVLKINLLKYISLILHPGIVTPTHVERCMNIAFSAKFNSGCISRQVGAVVTDRQYSIISIGWNSTAEGVVPCNLRSLNNLLSGEVIDEFSEFELKNNSFRNLANEINQKINDTDLSGRTKAYCFKDIYTKLKDEKNQVHTRSLHAEENAFLQIAKYGGRPIKEGILFTTASPCELCAKKAYQLGISKIFYIDPYPGISREHIISSGTNPPDLKLYYGAIGSAYTKLYNPIMSFKDELQLLSE